MSTQDHSNTSQNFPLLAGKVSTATLERAKSTRNPHLASSRPPMPLSTVSPPITPKYVNEKCSTDQEDIINYARHFLAREGKGVDKSDRSSFLNNRIEGKNSPLITISKYEMNYAGFSPANPGSRLSLFSPKKETRTSGHFPSTNLPKVDERPPLVYSLKRSGEIEKVMRPGCIPPLDPLIIASLPFPTTRRAFETSPVHNDNILGLSPYHINKAHDDLSCEIEARKGTAETRGATKARDTDPHYALKPIKSPVSSRDATFLAQWSNFTNDGMGSHKRGLSSAFARNDNNATKPTSKSIPVTPEQSLVILLASPIIVQRRELHHTTQHGLEETSLFTSDPFAVTLDINPIESSYFSPDGSPDLDTTPKAASQPKSNTLLSSNFETASSFASFETNLDDLPDPDGVHPGQVYLGRPENVKVGESHMTDEGCLLGERSKKLDPQVIPSLSTVPPNPVTHNLPAPRPQYGRKVSEPSVPSHEVMLNTVTRARSNTTASAQPFTGPTGTFLVEPPHSIVSVRPNVLSQNSMSFSSVKSSPQLWRRRAASRLASTGQSSLVQGPKKLLVPGSSGTDDEDAYELQCVMKALASDSLGPSSANETTTPVRSKFNDSNYGSCDSTGEDGLATPKASERARKCPSKVFSTTRISNGANQAPPLAADIIPHLPDPPRWVIKSPPRSAFDDDDGEAEDTDIYIDTPEEARACDASVL